MLLAAVWAGHVAGSSLALHLCLCGWALGQCFGADVDIT